MQENYTFGINRKMAHVVTDFLDLNRIFEKKILIKIPKNSLFSYLFFLSDATSTWTGSTSVRTAIIMAIALPAFYEGSLRKTISFSGFQDSFPVWHVLEHGKFLFSFLFFKYLFFVFFYYLMHFTTFFYLFLFLNTVFLLNFHIQLSFS